MQTLQELTVATSPEPSLPFDQELEALAKDPDRRNELGHFALLPLGAGEGYNDVMVRYFPAEQHRDIPSLTLDPTIAEGQRLIEAAQEHFEILRSLGLEVPTVILSHENQDPKAERSRIIRVTERVQGTRFAGSEEWDTVQRSMAPHDDQVIQLTEIVLNYFGWILNSTPAPELYLCDLVRLSQFRILPNGKIAFIDTDPMMINPNDKVGRKIMLDSLQAMEWRIQPEQLQPRSAEQAERIAQLHRTIRHYRREYL